MNKIYLKELKRKGDNKYQRIQLNEHYVLYKDYRIPKQVRFELYKHKPLMVLNKEGFPQIRFVHFIDIDEFLLVGSCSFLFNNKSLDFQFIWVTPSFRHNKTGTFLIKYFLETYFPDNDHDEILCEARTIEGKKLCEKLGFKKDNDYDDEETWFMVLKNPNNINFQKESDLNTITKKTINMFPKKEDFLKGIA